MPEGAHALAAYLPAFLAPLLGLARPRREDKAHLLRDGFALRLPVPEGFPDTAPDIAPGPAECPDPVRYPPAPPVLNPGPEPECGAEPATRQPERTPDSVPAARKRTPRRPLNRLEVPRNSAEAVIFSGAGVDPPLDARHPAAFHASRLQLFLTDHSGLDDPPISSGRLERGLFGWQVEQAYYEMCFQLWWHPHRWEGAGGVAEHFRRLVKRKPRYKWCQLSPDGEASETEHRRVFYPMPKPSLALGKPKAKRTPRSVGKRTPPKGAKRTPKRTPKPVRKRAPVRVRRIRPEAVPLVAIVGGKAA
jgi:hypothetical protein